MIKLQTFLTKPVEEYQTQDKSVIQPPSKPKKTKSGSSKHLRKLIISLLGIKSLLTLD